MNDKRAALVSLLDKYAVPYNEDQLDLDIPLLPWRSNRKYIELQKLVAGNVVEHPCLLRFCHLADNSMTLEEVLYREFDLCEFILGKPIVALHATFTDGCGNVIVKMQDGVVGSVEVGTQLPEGTAEVDRHEIVARRGVACDVAVDTQIPQQSIYLYTENGTGEYKDIDTELFGLSEKDVETVRAGFALITGRMTEEELVMQDTHLKQVVSAALASNEQKKKIEL